MRRTAKGFTAEDAEGRREALRSTCLTPLERDVTITVGPKKRERGRIELVSGT